MKLNWREWTKRLYSWRVDINSHVFDNYVKHTKVETWGRGINSSQLLDRIYRMSFRDFGKARELVRKYNKTDSEFYTYSISYERKI